MIGTLSNIIYQLRIGKNICKYIFSSMPWVGALCRSQLNVGLMLTAESACSPPSQTTTVSRIIQITKYCMKANTKY